MTDKDGARTDGPDRFKKLPERIRPQDMVATHPTAEPPDPTMGRDTERDFMLRNAAG